MQTRNRNTFTTIHTEGALLPVDLLQRISRNDKNLEGLTPESYHLAPGEKLTETINRSWNRLYGLWGAFQTARGQLGSNDAGTTLTRERWLLPLFQELGFGRLSTTKAVEIEGKSYPISHGWQNIPLHLVGCGLDLDKRTPGAAGAARTSPHSLLQEYLNQSDAAQWGVVTNGLRLRVLRDNATLTRQAYIEFDLEAMFDGEVYSDFTLVWLICHQSRFETSTQQSECILERWSKSAQESGTRALDALRRGVEEAIVNLGQGFLQHPLNSKLRSKLKQGDLTPQDYYRQLLRLVYRLIFLFVSEDRDLLLLPDATVESKRRFQKYYSTSHLRSLAEKQRGSRHHDRYEALQLVMTLLGSDTGCLELALPALGGFLFGSESTTDLNQAKLDNRSLLASVRSLAFITEGNFQRGVDYRNLGSEELGSVYEALLELHPLLNTDAGTFQLTSAAGNERKTTGSYYTPSSLINVLLDSALDPVIDDRLKGKQDAAQKEQALLDLKVCDPASGSGHFLISAAHRIAKKLAEIRAGGDEPSPNETRHALRDVIRHCIYGVDINPMAVELCKVNLWLESLEPGKPLSFLDGHIKCGNSLEGVGPKMDISELEVPDKAFNPVTGDHKATAGLLKKRNKQERAGQESLFVTVLKTHEDLDAWLANRTRAVEAMPENNTTEVQAKAEAYQKVNESNEFRKQRQIADLWTAAFFWNIEEPTGKSLDIIAPTHGQLHRLRKGSQTQSGLLEQVEMIRRSEDFFHWPLEFAEVAAQGGFDCVLGNPPWDMLQLNPQEFFAFSSPVIADAPNMSKRNKLIDQLAIENPTFYKDYQNEYHKIECLQKFVHSSNRFPLTSYGKINLMSLFAELAKTIIGCSGRAGLIIPTGIATDSYNQYFLGDLLEKNLLISLFDFENRDGIFPSVHRMYKFCLFIIGKKLSKDIQFVFFATQTDHLADPNRQFTMSNNDIKLINPNSKTLPIIRTQTDADLIKKIYYFVPVLLNNSANENDWGFRGLLMFYMNTDSHLFSVERKENFVPLYEAKMFWHYDHRWATLESESPNEISVKEKNKPDIYAYPRYWISAQNVEQRLNDCGWKRDWMMCYRAITNATNERSVITSVLPRVGAGNNAPVLITNNNDPRLITCLMTNLNSLVLDYVARLKIGGVNLNVFIVEQFPIIKPSSYTNTDISFIVPRVLELVYTAYDLKPFAKDMGYHGEPFGWDESRRASLRAELDAYYARLYSLNRKQLRYILDPADLTPRELEDILDPWEEVADPLNPQGYAQRAAASDFPGETFRVLKEKEFKLYGEYRTRRLVLEAWERLIDVEIHGPSASIESTPVQPITDSIRAAHSSNDMDSEDEHPDNGFSSPTPMSPPESESEPTQMDWTDFSLYKCLACGKITTGFDKTNHEQEKHSGKSVEWKKLK
jgi:hypothetical protein